MMQRMETLRISGYQIGRQKKIILFGTGMIGKLVIRVLKKQHKNVMFAIDNDSKKWNKRINGVKILDPAAGVHTLPDAVYIVANVKYSTEMVQQLVKMGVKECQILICDDIGKLNLDIITLGHYKTENNDFIFDLPQRCSGRAYAVMLGNMVKAAGYKILMNLFYPKNNMKKKYNVSICAIFRDEAAYLKEWIEYHKIIGIEHFYLYNNFSEDSYRAVLQPYLDMGVVDLIEWPYPQGQMAAYRDCVRKFRTESRWIGFIDLDEFVVPVDDDNLNDFLKKFEKNRGSVLIYWKLFGTSGKTKRKRSGLVTEDFTVCWRKHTNIGKCFYNTAYDFIPDFDKNSNMIHHSLWTGYQGKARPPVNCFDHVCLEGLNWTEGDHFPIQINHYFTKSLEEWNEKTRRGDVCFKQNPYNDAYFMEHEGKCGAVDVSVYKYMIPLKKRLFGRK